MDINGKAPIPPSMEVKAVIRPDRCERCKFSSPSEANPGMLECHRFPPHIQAFPMKGPQGDMRGFQEFTFLPKVIPINYCGEFRPRIEGLN